MAKPTLDDTRFGVTVGAVESTNLSNPASGLKDSAYASNSVPAGQNVSWLFRKIHAWFQFLDLLFDASTNLTLPVNASVTVSGTAKFKHSTRTLQIGPAGMAPIGANGQYNLASFNAGASTSVQASIRLPDGARILGARAFVQDSATGPTPLNVQIFSTNTTGGVASTIATSSNTAGSGANQTITVSGLTATLAASNGYQIVVQRASGTAAFNVFLIEIDYDEP